MRAKIPANYEFDALTVAQTITDILRANGLNPGVQIRGRVILTTEASIPAGVRSQIKAAVLPLLTDTSGDVDITV